MRLHAHARIGTLRDKGQIVLTNPDMLHASVLPAHVEWASLLSHLSLVVVDEAHMYRGAFGAHVALVLRRLRRVCALYGSAPRFACCSATVGNPAELFCGLTGIRRSDVDVVVRDGSPHGQRRLVLWNPPLRNQPTPIPEGKGVPVARDGADDEGGAERRASSNIEAAVLFAEMARFGKLRAKAASGAAFTDEEWEAWRA